MTEEEASGSPIMIGGTPPLPLRSAEFVLSVLTITPVEVQVGEEATISFLVTNVGDLEGTHTVDLLVNGVKEQSKTVTLAGGVSTKVSFSVTKSTAGSYAVKVGDLTGSFKVNVPGIPPGYIAGALMILIAGPTFVYALYRRGRLPLHNLPKRTPGAINQ
jgi:hypothetical protein